VAREAVAISTRIGDRTGVAHGLRNLAISYLVVGDSVEGRSMAKRAVSMADELGLPITLAYSYGYLALAEMTLGHYENAWVAGQKGLALCRENDIQPRVVWNLQALAVVALARGEYAEARDLVQQSLAISREIGQQVDVGWGLGILGIAAHCLGELAQARSCLFEALRAAAENRIHLMLQYSLTGSALILADSGDTQRAVEIYALAASQLSHVANSRWFEDVIEKHIAAAAVTLPPDVVAAAQERGRALDLWDTAERLLDELRG
jgi:tetratricopeptide (TPR) repeat protein